MDNTSTEPTTMDVNGTSTAADLATSDEMMEPSTSATTTAASTVTPCTYDDLFPSLPVAAPPTASAKVSGGGPIGDWNKKPMLSSSTVTQVFHIPMEERRGQLAAGGFGAEDSMKIIKSVMEKTHAKIEMSSNKDQSLTFLISGSKDSVLRARRELLAQFQVNLFPFLSFPS
jgi:hypothetical protein